VKFEREHSFREAVSSGINLFVGSGFSVLAHDTDDNLLPTGEALAEDLRSRFEVDPTRTQDLPRLATIIAASRRSELRDYLTHRFSVGGRFDPRYKSITGFNVSTLFTTNIDDLPFRIYEDHPARYLNDLDKNGPMIRDRAAVDYVALHGSVRNPDRPYRFGAAEIAASFGADPDRWRYLRQKLNSGPTLFWGYSLSDSGTLEALGAEGDLANQGQDMWIVLPADADEGEQEYFKALGFALISADTAEMLEFSAELGPASPVGEGLVSVSSASADVLAPYMVPEATRVALRPIDDFFCGASPEWSDIYSSQLVKTSHFARIVDQALGAGGVIAAGIPASGKSTLLMQVAAHMHHEGHRLILDGPTLAQAELLVRALDGARALVCVDNCTADIDAFLALVKAPGITVVGADRDYYLGIVLHRMDLRDSNIKVHGVTQLTGRDFQDIWDSIPVSLRQDPMVRPSMMSRRVEPSLFEFVQTNVKGPRLDQRLRTALRSLQADDSFKADLLLFVAYVHSCRTAVSLDMLLGYLNSPVIDYAEVSQLLRDVGEMLQENPDDYLDDEQDHYTTRSLIAGEAVLDAASAPELATMLTRFYENLSPIRITDYQVFKRRALKAHLFAKAFPLPRYEEGVKIYDAQYAREDTPYILQHKAQYLSRLGKHQDAFDTIELAAARARKNWTITNAHAQILFRANLGRIDIPGAQTLVDRAMRTLTRCYNSDRRKTVHALQFAEFAEDYSRVYSDPQALEYLQQAQSWLREAERREPWMMKVRQLKGSIQRRLDQFEFALEAEGA
jgi:tetratricopeptide (TPR) repeat protein